MKKELAIHFFIALILFVPIFLLKYLAIQNWPFIAGAVLGTFLPDVDHIIYIYFLRPYELTSQRVMFEANKGNLLQSWNLLSSSRSERTNLILHTVLFQILFLILAFLAVSSSPSLFGRGVVLAFLLHLLVDEIIDLRAGSFPNWLKNIPFQFDNLQIKIYLLANFLIILLFGFLF